MARNRLAGTKTGKSNSARHYQENPESKKKKQEYDTKYNQSAKRKRYRAELQRKNREKGTHGNLDGMDEAHVSKTKTRRQRQSRNRADKKRVFFK